MYNVDGLNMGGGGDKCFKMLRIFTNYGKEIHFSQTPKTVQYYTLKEILIIGENEQQDLPQESGKFLNILVFGSFEVFCHHFTLEVNLLKSIL